MTRPEPTSGSTADASYAGADLVDPDAALAEVVDRLRLTDPAPAGAGLEFLVYRAESRDQGPVAVRVPRYRTYRFPGRKPFTAGRSLEQERLICAGLYPRGFPVAEPLATVETAQAPVLVSRFLLSDRHGADSGQVGALLARLHGGGVPAGLRPLDHDGYPVVEALTGRLSRRWAHLTAHVPELPPPPAPEWVAAALAPVATSPVLVHLDIRSCNLMTADDRIVGWVDWTCAMIGHPVLELARVSEYAQLPENGIDFAELRAGYASVAPVPRLDGRVEALVRLDTVLMLGVIFFDYAPDTTRQEWVRSRLRELVPAVTG